MIERLLNATDVTRLTTLSHGQISVLEKQAEFPPRYCITGNRTGWKLSEVIEWINKRKRLGYDGQL